MTVLTYKCHDVSCSEVDDAIKEHELMGWELVTKRPWPEDRIILLFRTSNRCLNVEDKLFISYREHMVSTIPTVPVIGKRYEIQVRGTNGSLWKADATRIEEFGIMKWKLDGYSTKFIDEKDAPKDWPWICLKVIRKIDD